MKKYIWVLFLLGIISCGGKPAFAGQLNIIWDYDFTNDTPCAPSLTVNCLQDFVVYHTDLAGNRVTDFVLVAPPTGSGLTAGLQSGFFTTKNIYGVNNYCVVARGKYTAGLQESQPGCVGATLAPGVPSNVRYQTR